MCISKVERCLRAARSVQVSVAHSGDINVGVQSKRMFVPCSGSMAHGMLSWWDVACRLFFRARLTEAQGKGSLGYSSLAPAVVSARRVLLILGLFGFSASCGHFQLHTRSAFTPARSEQQQTSKPSRHQPQETQKDQILGGASVHMCSCL